MAGSQSGLTAVELLLQGGAAARAPGRRPATAAPPAWPHPAGPPALRPAASRAAPLSPPSPAPAALWAAALRARHPASASPPGASPTHISSDLQRQLAEPWPAATAGSTEAGAVSPATAALTPGWPGGLAPDLGGSDGPRDAVDGGDAASEAVQPPQADGSVASTLVSADLALGVPDLQPIESGASDTGTRADSSPPGSGVHGANGGAASIPGSSAAAWEPPPSGDSDAATASSTERRPASGSVRSTAEEGPLQAASEAFWDRYDSSASPEASPPPDLFAAAARLADLTTQTPPSDPFFSSIRKCGQASAAPAITPPPQTSVDGAPPPPCDPATARASAAAGSPIGCKNRLGFSPPGAAALFTDSSAERPVLLVPAASGPCGSRDASETASPLSLSGASHPPSPAPQAVQQLVSSVTAGAAAGRAPASAAAAVAGFPYVSPRNSPLLGQPFWDSRASPAGSPHLPAPAGADAIASAPSGDPASQVRAHGYEERAAPRMATAGALPSEASIDLLRSVATDEAFTVNSPEVMRSCSAASSEASIDILPPAAAGAGTVSAALAIDPLQMPAAAGGAPPPAAAVGNIDAEPAEWMRGDATAIDGSAAAVQNLPERAPLAGGPVAPLLTSTFLWRRPTVGAGDSQEAESSEAAFQPSVSRDWRTGVPPHAIVPPCKPIPQPQPAAPLQTHFSVARLTASQGVPASDAAPAAQPPQLQPPLGNAIAPPPGGSPWDVAAGAAPQPPVPPLERQLVEVAPPQQLPLARSSEAARPLGAHGSLAVKDSSASWASSDGSVEILPAAATAANLATTGLYGPDEVSTPDGAQAHIPGTVPPEGAQPEVNRPFDWQQQLPVLPIPLAGQQQSDKIPSGRDEAPWHELYTQGLQPQQQQQQPTPRYAWESASAAAAVAEEQLLSSCTTEAALPWHQQLPAAAPAAAPANSARTPPGTDSHLSSNSVWLEAAPVQLPAHSPFQAAVAAADAEAVLQAPALYSETVISRASPPADVAPLPPSLVGPDLSSSSESMHLYGCEAGAGGGGSGGGQGTMWASPEGLRGADQRLSTSSVDLDLYGLAAAAHTAAADTAQHDGPPTLDAPPLAGDRLAGAAGAPLQVQVRFFRHRRLKTPTTKVPLQRCVPAATPHPRVHLITAGEKPLTPPAERAIVLPAPSHSSVRLYGRPTADTSCSLLEGAKPCDKLPQMRNGASVSAAHIPSARRVLWLCFLPGLCTIAANPTTSRTKGFRMPYG